ncbi:hypothetical protein O9929_09870 [Vibrio lentus]|nr:hypothetical protein [Vibrio lentus]
MQDEPLEGFDDFDETALKRSYFLKMFKIPVPTNMFDKPLDATSIDSAGLDIDAMLGNSVVKIERHNLAPEQQSSMHNDVAS